MTKTTRVFILFTIVGLGLVVRLIHLWAIMQSTWPERHLVATESDDRAFFEWAEAILAGDWLGRDTYHPHFAWMRGIAPMETWYEWWGGRETFHQAPLYPYLLAGFLALSKGSIAGVFFAQLTLGAFQPLIMYRLGTILFESRVGLVAAAVSAFYGPFIFHEATLLRDWLSPILDPLALLAFLEARRSGRSWAWVAAGASLGLALLAKEFMLFFLPFLLLWIIFEHRRAWTQAARAGSWVLLGLMLSLSPLILRNIAVGASPFAISNRASEVFLWANMPHSDRATNFATILEFTQGQFLPLVRTVVHSYVGAWRPFLDLQLWKIQVLKNVHEYPNNVSYSYGEELSPILRWTIGYGLVFPFGLAGLILFWKTWRQHLLLLLYGIAVVGGLMVTSPIARYRLTLIPVLIVYSAAFVMHTTLLVRERPGRKLLTSLALVFSLVFLQQAIARPRQAYVEVYPYDYTTSSRVHASHNRFEFAVAEMVRLQARLIHVGGSPAEIQLASLLEGLYRSGWALHLVREGDRDKAAEQAKLAESAYSRQSMPTGALAYNLGLAFFELGQADKAREYLGQFLELEPTHPLAEPARLLLLKLNAVPGSALGSIVP